MALSSGEKCARYASIALHFVYLALGGVILGLGVWFILGNELSLLSDILPDRSIALPELFLHIGACVGGLAFLLGSLGLCATIIENRKVLSAYGLLIAFLLAAEVVTAVVVAVFWTDSYDYLVSDMSQSLRDNYNNTDDPSLDSSAAWNNMQRQMQCCGAHRDDYGRAKYYRLCPDYNDCIYPDSCCPSTNEPPCTSSNNLYWLGCYYVISDWLDRNVYIMIISVGSLVGVQIICMIMACILRSSLKNGPGPEPE